jgi:hypothetical protein|tara:strand:- start:40 stop:606 length:567 start_codon:yes stop_codon:yes gene_type:complete
MKRIIESYLPIFQGFYGTLFECDAEEVMIEEDKNYDDYNWDYTDYHNRVAKACVSPIQDQLNDLDLGITVEFQSLYSPREYNFSNDSINVAYTLADDSLAKIVEYINDNREEFDTYVKDNCTSYDGFMSFYSNDSNVWLNEYIKRENDDMATVFGHLLEFMLSNEEFTASHLAEEVQEEMNMIDCELI